MTCGRCKQDVAALVSVPTGVGPGKSMRVCDACEELFDAFVREWMGLGGVNVLIANDLAIRGPEPLAPVLDRLDVLLGGGQEALTLLARIARAVDAQTEFMKGATTYERSESRLNGPDGGLRGD